MAEPAEPSRSGLNVVTRGTLLLFAATLVFIGASFVWRVLLVRTLSATDWDAFSDSIAIASVVAMVGGLGLQNTLARNLPYTTSDPERRALVRTALLYGGLSCVAIPVALYFAGPAIGAATGSSAVTLGVQIIGLAWGFYEAATLLTAIFQGFEVVWPYAVFVYVVGPVLFVGLLGAAYADPALGISYPFALGAYAAAYGIAFGLALAYTWRSLPTRLPRGSRAPDRTVPTLLFALPLLGVAVFSYLNGYADTIVLGTVHFSEVGTYVASLTLVRLLPIGVTALSFIMLPVTARLLRTGERAAAETTFATATKWTTVFSLPLFLIFVFLPGPSLLLVYGPAYSSITLPLMIAGTGGFLSTIVGPSAAVQIALAHTRLLLVNASVSVAADVILALVLVPPYGMTGSAIAWAIAAVAYPGLAAAELAYLDRIHPFRRTYVLPLIATALPAALLLTGLRFVHVPGWSLIVLGALLAVFYVLMIVATRSVDQGDSMLLGIVERLIGHRLDFARRIGAWGLRRGGAPPTGGGP